MKLLTAVFAVQAFLQLAHADVPAMLEPKREEELLYHERIGTIDGPVGQVEKVSKSPRVDRFGGQGDGSTLALGGYVFQGDKAKTNEEAKIHIRYRDKTYVELYHNSSFGAERVRRGSIRNADRKDESVFRFYYGLVRITAPSVEPYVRYYVKHNERIISLEGPSDFYLEQKPETGNLIIHMRRGNAVVMSSTKGIKADVAEGQSREIRKDNTIKSLQPLSEKDLGIFRRKTAIKLNQ